MPTPAPPPATRSSGWTPGRTIALGVGTLMVLASLGFIGAGATALWAGTFRDDAGFVTTNAHTFSTTGSALVTDPVELGSPGVDWLYSGTLLGTVRVRVTPASPDTTVFVGIAPSGDVARYLSGVDHTTITDFWSDTTRAVSGTASATPPGDQPFWAASVSGSGPQTLTWEPANGSWSVVVMDPDATPGVTVTADLGAEMPSLTAMAVVSLSLAVLALIAGAVLIVGAVRRTRSQ